MGKTNKFHVKKYDEDKSKITIEEERKYRNPFILFLIDNGKLIFTISLLLTVTVLIIAVTLIFSNIKDSSIVYYESNGVVVTFDGDDNSIINGTPITSEYANKVFDSNLVDNNYFKGVVIKIGEKNINNGIVMFYSDKTIIIKYNDGTYKRIFPIDGNYGINENNEINANAIYKDLTGENKRNDKLGIDIIYLSDGSVIIDKDNVNFFVRNSDITSNDISFFTNLSGVSVPIKNDNNKLYYSNGTIKENDYILVDNIKYLKIDEKKVHDNIKVIYYDNGYAEVIYNNTSIIVEKSEHINYDDNVFEIIDSNNNGNIIDIKDVMDIKSIKLENKNTSKANYMIVLEETNDYTKHNITRRLSTEYINYNVYVNGNIISDKVLNNKLDNTSGINNKNNNYLIYEGEIEKLSELSIKIGMWISYENITNEYMNSAFIGTMKVYIESK
ncbi:MAG: hypothetical protein ACI4U4_03740 [Bacilli bacterium]